MSHTISLTPADLDLISSGGTVTVSTPDVTFELTDEDHYTSPAFSYGVCRIGLDARRISDLRRRIPRQVWAVGVDGIVAFTTDEIEAALR